jgi:hypothetical protein
VRLHGLADGPHRLRLHAFNRFGSVTVAILWTLPATRTTVVSTPVEVSPPELPSPAG